MPNNGDVSGYTGVFRLASPTDPQRKVIKRNRQVISCVPCRTRKLRCDRRQPCASCVRRHDEGSCRFFGSGGGGASSSSSSSVVGGGGGVAGHGDHQHRHHAAVDGGEGHGHGRGLGREALRRKEVKARLSMLEDMVSAMIGHGGSGRQSQIRSRSRERRLDGDEADADSAAATPAEPGTGEAAAVGGGTGDSVERSPAAAGDHDSLARAAAAGGGHHLSRQGDEVRFVGATNYAAVLSCIRELQGYVDANSTTDDDASPAREEQQQQRQRVDNGWLSGVDANPVTIHEVLERLPPKSECDGILTFYFQQIYLIPVLIHTGQFQRAYEKFWEGPSRTSLLWTSILFTLLSTSVFLQASKAIGSENGSGALGPDARERIAGFSAMAYRCLVAGGHLQSKPHCVEATILFGMHLVLQKRDAEPLCWHTIATAVRLAQRMGYHRDASHLGRSGGAPVSPFEAEMRRRTWYTLEYFDVVYSFQWGIPPIIRGEDVDARLPMNLRDDEFDEDTRVLPRARPSAEFTPILCFAFYSRQVQLLRRVVQHTLAVTTTTPPSNYNDDEDDDGAARRLDADLRALHDEVPPSLRYRPVAASGFADLPDVIMRRVTSEMMHLKCLCMLHRRYLTYGRDEGPEEQQRRGGDARWREDRREACRDAALRLLAIQAEFEEQSREGGRLFEKRHMLTLTGYHDFLVAAMCICLDVIAAGERARNQADHDRKVEALRKARDIWAKAASQSNEAAHAVRVLEQILAKVSPPPPSVSPSTWPAVNNNSPARTPHRAPAKSYSVEWSYAWLDNLGGSKEQTEAGHDPLNHLLGGGVDWSLIDSFLLDREHTTASSPSASVIPPTKDSASASASASAAGGTGGSASGGSSDKASRDGWPYMRYEVPTGQQEGERDQHRAQTTGYRTWSSAGITLGGFGPSSSGSTFI